MCRYSEIYTVIPAIAPSFILLFYIPNIVPNMKKKYEFLYFRKWTISSEPKQFSKRPEIRPQYHDTVNMCLSCDGELWSKIVPKL